MKDSRNYNGVQTNNGNTHRPVCSNSVFKGERSKHMLRSIIGLNIKPTAILKAGSVPVTTVNKVVQKEKWKICRKILFLHYCG